ncbi:uncharacterized protein I303_106200 [Kwoniella dejecticola CBS 10117]|uniref:Uncharacterized protein n=1 Tax=Kwoniella dejecticola CBS 10117 TaxID=1296121 RepID=A0A1A6A1J2_9TREE|nr:uncharacterized protein I303_06218 [Kwoniella dejecticola CBS 10117]OBR83932.1 hypothetical protein I303_06218 [Kwoniella dejecticola CBS 10117]
MGNCFSDPSSSHKPSQGQKLGSGPPKTPAQQTQTGTTRRNNNNEPPRTVGGGLVAVDNDGDPRERALKAAEERAKASQKKGVNTSNPKAGQLSAKLAAENRNKAGGGAGAGAGSPNANESRMMDRGEWN